ncbi:MAG TPA: MerR family transcriptional regulator [Nocardioidaceae bacterium]|nr:MerR family transcriptional regulator [Nocardioidaceae bacterium]
MEQTIGEVARRTGVTERTLRYYEVLGLLTPRRDTGGRRRYDVEQVDRLYRIRLMRELGHRATLRPKANRCLSVGLSARRGSSRRCSGFG